MPQEPAGVYHSYRGIHGRQVDELSLGDLLARLDAIIEMEADGRISCTLGPVTALACEEERGRVS